MVVVVVDVVLFVGGRVRTVWVCLIAAAEAAGADYLAARKRAARQWWRDRLSKLHRFPSPAQLGSRVAVAQPLLPA